ncbi:TPA: phage holin family protein [Enterobacter hormaechei]|nr:phage holin family protein [Enterobacter hormaechei]
MVIDPSAVFNAFICAAIVIVLMFYQRHGARHRPFISVLAYITVLVYAAIPLQFIFGLYACHAGTNYRGYIGWRSAAAILGHIQEHGKT